MPEQTQIATVRIGESPETHTCRIVHEAGEPLSRADAQEILAQAVTAPGTPADIRVEGITPDPEIGARLTPLSEMEVRLDMLARCQAVTQARRACEFVGIVNDKADHFIAVSAPTVDAMGYLVGDILTKALSPEDAHTFLQAMERLVAHYGHERCG
jgi:hypothetical protein